MPCMQLCVELTVISHPRLFNETDSSMDHFDPQTKAFIQLECFVRNSASLHIIQIWKKSFYFVYHELSAASG